MKLAYSPKCVLFLALVSKVATIFGIVPSYDFRKRKLNHTNLYNCYMLLFVCFFTSYLFAFMYLHYSWRGLPTILVTVNVLADLVDLTWFLLTALGSRFWNRKNWDSLMIQLSKFERSANLNAEKSRKTSIWESNLLHFSVSNLCFLAFVALQVVCFETTTHVLNQIPSFALQYMKLVLTLLVYNLTLSVKSKYRILHETLLVIDPNVPDKKNVRVIRRVRILSLKMDSIVETFNSYFGWPILFLLADAFAEILNSLVIFTLFVKEGILTNELLVLILGHIITGLSFILILTVGCDRVYKMSGAVFKKCHELKITLPLHTKEAEELDNLQITLRNQTKFSAAGFFEINRSVLLSIFSSLTTYMIVIIQFNSL